MTIKCNKIRKKKRFRFCGDLDCPDWVLAEIATLSRITSIKMKMLCTHVTNDILGNPIDYEKVNKLTADAKYELGDVKASIAALKFIITSAAKNGVDEESLSNELQQLGLPKELASALCKVFADKYSSLQKALKENMLSLPRIENVQWRVDYVLCSSHLKEVNEPSVQLCLKTKDPNSNTTQKDSFTISKDKFLVLLHELKQAYKTMEGIV